MTHVTNLHNALRKPETSGHLVDPLQHQQLLDLQTTARVNLTEYLHQPLLPTFDGVEGIVGQGVDGAGTLRSHGGLQFHSGDEKPDEVSGHVGPAMTDVFGD